MRTSSSNKQQLMYLEGNMEYYESLIAQTELLIRPLAVSFATLKNETVNLGRVNQIWTNNFKIMDNQFNQLKKRVKGFKYGSASYPSMFWFSTSKTLASIRFISNILNPNYKVKFLIVEMDSRHVTFQAALTHGYNMVSLNWDGSDLWKNRLKWTE